MKVRLKMAFPQLFSLPFLRVSDRCDRSDISTLELPPEAHKEGKHLKRTFPSCPLQVATLASTTASNIMVNYSNVWVLDSRLARSGRGKDGRCLG